MVEAVLRKSGGIGYFLFLYSTMPAPIAAMAITTPVIPYSSRLGIPDGGVLAGGIDIAL